MKNEIIEKLNYFSRHKVPFVALLSYDTSQDDVVCALDEADKFAIKFKLNLTTKNDKSDLDYDFQTFPIDFKTYQKSFNKVIEYMKSGDVYLLNLCFKTGVKTSLTLDEIYERSNANLVLKFKDSFVCFSPEIFITIQNDKITTHPMKGTIDAKIKNAKKILLDDEKEFSEQAMVTDLMRNDLSMVASGVRVDKFRYFSKVETKKGSIFQTSTEISGALRDEFLHNYGDIFHKILPAGSISGTPKILACEIIKECELAKRGFYTGVFVYFDGTSLKSWVLIRFIEHDGKNLAFKTGGGITVQSDVRKEYDEMLEKAYLTFWNDKSRKWSGFKPWFSRS